MEPLAFDLVEDAHVWMRERFGTWASSRPGAQLRALLAYKAAGYVTINGALRSGVVTAEAAAVSDAISDVAVPDSVMVYRGIDDHRLTELVLFEAAEIPHKGFVSVSVVRHVAESFLYDGGNYVAEDESEARNVLLIGVLAAGTHAAPLDLVPEAVPADEAELLLPAGSTFVVERVDYSDLALIEVHGTWITP